MSMIEAIRHANRLLPGMPAAEGEEDARWQAIIAVGDYIQTDPEAVWEFVRRWGVHPQVDVRDAIATCLLEHLLEHHFKTILPRVEQAITEDRLFADTLLRCWKFGPENSGEGSAEIGRLQTRCRKKLQQ